MNDRTIALIGGLLLASFWSSSTIDCAAQEHSIVRQWNERILSAIRRDLARPPVQARNIYHVSAAMYEAWAAYDPKAEPFLLGRTRSGYTCHFDGVAAPADIHTAREKAISFAAYRLLAHRFQNSPGVFLTMLELNALMDGKGYDRNNISVDYVNGGPAELGNYIASQIMAYGLVDGSNEQLNYANQYYAPFNTPLLVEQPGNPSMADPDRWQQITLSLTIDQQGNPIPSTPPFQSPEWGNVDPFALGPDQMDQYVRDGHTYKVYLDPGAPAYLDTTNTMELESFYKWNFCMVPIWQSHLDPNDGVMIDISPASKGNIQSYPTTEQGIRDFYNYFDGGDPGTGHALNPATGAPYEPQLVKRGDYTRILAEFWADGPSSETPPGHWFSIMHEVMDHPLFERKWMGEGDELDELEYDTKAHLVLAGALHDAAITAWGIKGWYDYVRPISAVRYMAQRGQSSDALLPNFHPAGMPLIPGHIELVVTGDPLAGDFNEHVGKVKLYTWRGPTAIADPLTDIAGVGWVLAENWYPYQRPTFVTPPFAGYISGHSTYSRTAAEVMTLITGDPFFPGGMSNFIAPQNDFLHFEQGPSEEIILQWATYRDASDQCSLSRIWGGIHPPIDDIPGRQIGMILGPAAVDQANTLFNVNRPSITLVISSDPILNGNDVESQFTVDIVFDRPMDPNASPVIDMLVEDPILSGALIQHQVEWVNDSTYRVTYELLSVLTTLDNIHMRMDSAIDMEGRMQNVHLAAKPFRIDTERPTVVSVLSSVDLINDAVAANGSLELFVTLDEACMTSQFPAINWISMDDLSGTLILDNNASEWLSPTTIKLVYQVIDNNEEVEVFGIEITELLDAAGNTQYAFTQPELLTLDTREPLVSSITLSTVSLSLSDIGQQAFSVVVLFDEIMNTGVAPEFTFIGGDPLQNSLITDGSMGEWLDPYTFQRTYTLIAADEEFADLAISITQAQDMAANGNAGSISSATLNIDTKRPEITITEPSVTVVANANVGTGSFNITLLYSEAMDPGNHPEIVLLSGTDLSGSLVHEAASDLWTSSNSFQVNYTVLDEHIEVSQIGISSSGARDLSGNEQMPSVTNAVFDLDTRDPGLVLMTATTYSVSEIHIGNSGLQFIILFDEPMDPTVAPMLTFNGNVDGVLVLNEVNSTWLNNNTYRAAYDVQNVQADLGVLSVELSDAQDLAGNPMAAINFPDHISVNITVVGIMESASFTFGLYPNPVVSGEGIWLELPDHIRNPYLTLFDMKGVKIHQHQLVNAGPGTTWMPLRPIAEGAYILQLESESKHSRARIVFMNGVSR